MISYCGRFFAQLGVEIPLCLYTITALFKVPIYQNLVYEKLCLRKYNDSIFCSNVTLYHDDEELQTQHAYFFWISQSITTIPSIIVTLLLGIASDYLNPKIPMIFPFIGAACSALNCLIQSVFLWNSIYWLTIGDAIFGLFGGSISITSTGMTFGVKTTQKVRRSYRIAGMEGALGLGGTLGFIFSGIIRDTFGYANAFAFMFILLLLATVYIAFMSKKEHLEGRNQEDLLLSDSEISMKSHLRLLFFDFWRLLSTPRLTRTLIWLNLFVLAMEFVLFTGMAEIQYSYLRFKFAWTDKEYGYFSATGFGLSTTAVLVLYPFLHFHGMSDAQLSCLGTATKIISVFLLASLSTPSFIYSVVVANMFNRFITSGYRAFLSSLTEDEEQGRLFSLTSLIEGLANLLSAAVYSILYPWTLHFFPGLLFIISGVFLLPSIGILCYSDWKIKKIVAEEEENERRTS